MHIHIHISIMMSHVLWSSSRCKSNLNLIQIKLPILLIEYDTQSIISILALNFHLLIVSMTL